MAPPIAPSACAPNDVFRRFSAEVKRLAPAGESVTIVEAGNLPGTPPIPGAWVVGGVDPGAAVAVGRRFGLNVFVDVDPAHRQWKPPEGCWAPGTYEAGRAGAPGVYQTKEVHLDVGAFQVSQARGWVEDPKKPERATFAYSGKMGNEDATFTLYPTGDVRCHTAQFEVSLDAHQKKELAEVIDRHLNAHPEDAPWDTPALHLLRSGTERVEDMGVSQKWATTAGASLFTFSAPQGIGQSIRASGYGPETGIASEGNAFVFTISGKATKGGVLEVRIPAQVTATSMEPEHVVKIQIRKGDSPAKTLKSLRAAFGHVAKGHQEYGGELLGQVPSGSDQTLSQLQESFRRAKYTPVLLKSEPADGKDATLSVGIQRR